MMMPPMRMPFLPNYGLGPNDSMNMFNSMLNIFNNNSFSNNISINNNMNNNANNNINNSINNNVDSIVDTSFIEYSYNMDDSVSNRNNDVSFVSEDSILEKYDVKI